MFLSLFLELAVAAVFEPHTGLLFPSGLVNTTLPDGRTVLIFGAFFPSGGSLPLTNEALERSATIAFPSICRDVIISTRSSESLVLDQGNDPQNPISERCVWYYSRPSQVSITVQAKGGSALWVENVDGAVRSEKVSEGSLVYLLEHSILVRWSNKGSDSTSFARFRAVQRDNSIPYPDRTFRFSVSDEPVYFLDKSPRAEQLNGMVGTSDLAKRLPWLIPGLTAGLACIVICCALWVKSRTGERLPI